MKIIETIHCKWSLREENTLNWILQIDQRKRRRPQRSDYRLCAQMNWRRSREKTKRMRTVFLAREWGNELIKKLLPKKRTNEVVVKTQWEEKKILQIWHQRQRHKAEENGSIARFIRRGGMWWIRTRWTNKQTVEQILRRWSEVICVAIGRTRHWPTVGERSETSRAVVEKRDDAHSWNWRGHSRIC